MIKRVQKPRRVQDTKAMKLLARRLKEVTTLVQFEEMIATAHEDHRARMRFLLEPLLPKDLPCCGPALLSNVTGKLTIQHAPRCRAGFAVKLTDE